MNTKDYFELKEKITSEIYYHCEFFSPLVYLLSRAIHNPATESADEGFDWMFIDSLINLKFEQLTNNINQCFQEPQPKPENGETIGKQELEKDLFLFKQQVFNILNEHYHTMDISKKLEILEDRTYEAFSNFEKKYGIDIDLTTLAEAEEEADSEPEPA